MRWMRQAVVAEQLNFGHMKLHRIHWLMPPGGPVRTTTPIFCASCQEHILISSVYVRDQTTRCVIEVIHFRLSCTVLVFAHALLVVSKKITGRVSSHASFSDTSSTLIMPCHLFSRLGGPLVSCTANLPCITHWRSRSDGTESE